MLIQITQSQILRNLSNFPCTDSPFSADAKNSVLDTEKQIKTKLRNYPWYVNKDLGIAYIKDNKLIDYPNPILALLLINLDVRRQEKMASKLN